MNKIFNHVGFVGVISRVEIASLQGIIGGYYISCNIIRIHKIQPFKPFTSTNNDYRWKLFKKSKAPSNEKIFKYVLDLLVWKWYKQNLPVKNKLEFFKQVRVWEKI